MQYKYDEYKLKPNVAYSHQNNFIKSYDWFQHNCITGKMSKILITSFTYIFYDCTISS